MSTETVNDPYDPDFTSVPGGTPSDYEFTGDGVDADDHFAITTEGYICTDPSPGGWSSSMFLPDLGIKERTQDGGVVIEWQSMYPSPNTGGSYRELNKFYLSLADGNDTLLYRFMYRPLTTATQKLVPFGAGAAWIRFKMELTPTNIRISMDHDGSGFTQYIDAADAQNYSMLIDNTSITPLK